MLFVTDVGNTDTMIGVFPLGGGAPISWRLGTDERRTMDEYEVLLDSLLARDSISKNHIVGAVISSVVPTLTGVFENLYIKMFGFNPLIIGPGVKTGMPIKLDNPREVGADRIANGVAAYETYGGPTVVADFGTATTFDVISPGGDYLGGTIAPGINISMEALFQRAAKLPRVEIHRPPKIIGKNTVMSIQAGVLCSVIGCVDYTVAAIEEEMGEKVRVIATGGLAPVVGGLTPKVDIVDQELTLRGLKIIYCRNK